MPEVYEKYYRIGMLTMKKIVKQAMRTEHSSLEYLSWKIKRQRKISTKIQGDDLGIPHIPVISSSHLISSYLISANGKRVFHVVKMRDLAREEMLWQNYLEEHS